MLTVYMIRKKKKINKKLKLSDKNIYKLSDKKINSYGSGGMITKLDAAKICINAGCYMFMANGIKKSN